MDLQRDGFINNNAAGQIATGPSNGGDTILRNIDSDIDGRDLYTYRITALWDITDKASATLLLQQVQRERRQGAHHESGVPTESDTGPRLLA